MPAQPLTHRIEGQPDFSMVTVSLPAGASLKVEASAMAAMDTNLSIHTRMKGGLGRLLTGESVFVNEITAERGAGEISIAPASPGDIAHVYLNNETIYLQNSAFLASSPEIKIESKWQGFTRGFFSGESFFLIKCSGTGDIWFNTFGGMIELPEVESTLIVDTGHIVAFTEGLNYAIQKIGGYKSLFFSGEGLVCRFSGKGRIWIQTRKLNRFLAWIDFFRPVKDNS